MGALGGLLGLSGGQSGTGIAAPTLAPVIPGTSPTQLGIAYGGAQNSLASQQALLQALQAQGGLNNQSQNYAQLQGVINGTGFNPARSMLNQATGQNVANQGALMAGQRGASSNPGLIARQAAQQGAATQQQAVGQGATLQANQSLGALGQAGALANTQAANQIAGVNENTQANLNEQQVLQGALAAQNQAGVAAQGNVNAANAGLSGQVLQGQQGLIGGALQGGGAAIGLLADGGEVSKYADGGQAVPSLGIDTMLPMAPALPIESTVSQFMKQQAGIPAQTMPMTGSQRLQQGTAAFGKAIGSMLSQGGNVGSELKAGGGVPGQAKVAGNSYSNDTVPALLSPGEVVIPRSVMGSKDPSGAAARFVQAVLAKKGGKK